MIQQMSCEMKNLMDQNSLLENHLNTVGASIDENSDVQPSPESETDRHSVSMPFDCAQSLIMEMTETNT